MGPFSGQNTRYDSQRGVALVNMLIGIAIAGVVAAAATTVITRTGQSAKNIRNRAEVAQIRSDVIRFIDCRSTIAAMSASDCQSHQPIDLYSKGGNGPILIAKPRQQMFTKIGNTSLQATCESWSPALPNKHKLVIHYAVLAGRQGYMRDPMTGALLDWNYGADLFEGIPIPCEVPF